MESEWYNVWSVVSVTLSIIGVYSLMAFRKPKPIGEGINFDEQSVVTDVRHKSFINYLYSISIHLITTGFTTFHIHI
jgi:hypothetical protein